MRTLLIESSPGVGVEAATALTAAGHEVLRCRQPGAPAFPCTEVLEPGSCPLDGLDPVDVVLVTRAARDQEPTMAESGVTCAVRMGIPVTVLGHSSARNPYAGWTDLALSANPILACEAIAAAAHEVAVEPLRTEVVRMLVAAGCTLSADDVAVDLVQRDGRAHLTVTVPADVPVSLETIATHVHARFRDTRQGWLAQVIDVSVGPAG